MNLIERRILQPARDQLALGKLRVKALEIGSVVISINVSVHFIFISVFKIN